MTEPKLITELWAWVCTESDGGEGIPAINGPMGPMPLIGADRDRIESLRRHAESVARDMGIPVSLRRFTTMEIIEHIEVPVSGRA